MAASEDRYAEGMQVRREVLGDAHVDRATAAATEVDADFQRWITETVWGGIWTRPGLDRRTRRMLTIAVLAALGHEELAMHIRAAREDLATSEISEVLLHVAAYAGVPAGNRSMQVAKEIVAEWSA